MPFNRPPRIHASLPDDIVEIPPPPELPARPGAFGWLATLLPIGGSLLVAGLLMTAGGVGGAGYIMMLPTMAVGSFIAWLNHRSQWTTYRSHLQAAKVSYRESLRRAENRLQSLRERERQIRIECDPDLDACLRRIEEGSARLGERRPGDPDFLCPRMGTGLRAASFGVESPDRARRPEELQELSDRADGMPERFLKIPAVPIVVPLARYGSIGIAGSRREVPPLARALLCHLATHHWPTEVRMAALPGAADPRAWDWILDLPHAARIFDAPSQQKITPDQPTSRFMTILEDEMRRREQLLSAQSMIRDSSAGMTVPFPSLVVILDCLPNAFTHPALTRLLRVGKTLAVFGIFLTDAPESVPGECGAIIRVRDRRAFLVECGARTEFPDVLSDDCSAAAAERLAKALAGIDWPSDNDPSQPPNGVGLLDILGADEAGCLPVEEWWDAGSPFGFLRAPIGRTSATADFVFDLRDEDGAHGPHGLVGGMTGSGKSEVLKSLILALALMHHPYDLNFVLIDYKGGAAFTELSALPHTVGVVTDIESHSAYAVRILAALGGEMERRKRMLATVRGIFRLGRSHVDEYRTLAVRRPLPHLVVVFDEFAEFKGRHPEESKRLISIARLGRSLGVHLILATQNIQAAVDPQILQNSTFRICLKVSQPEDSLQMVGIPDAIQLPRGRAFFFSQARTLVQIAYTGASCRRDGGSPQPGSWIRIRRNGRRETVQRADGNAAESRGREIPPPTETQALVDRINRAMRTMRLSRPPAVWMDPLPERLCLPEWIGRHTTGGWDGTTWRPARKKGSAFGPDSAADPILGVCDLPDRQEQPILEFPTAATGSHMLVFGSAGSGKTTLFRTLAASIARLRQPSEAQIYILDYAGQSALRPLEEFPHVGAVITHSERERTERLIRFLHREITRRSALFRETGVNGFADYNGLAAPDGRLPEIFLFIDGFLELKRAFPPEFIHAINSLAGGSASSGVHLAVSASLPGDLPGELAANINFQVTFHQTSRAEYAVASGFSGSERNPEDSDQRMIPGRGFLKGNPAVEWQAALPEEGENDLAQSSRLAETARRMKAAWTGRLPERIINLAGYVSLGGLGGFSANRESLFTPLGRDFECLAPVGFSLDRDGPTFLIAGATPQSGKTTLLRSWLLGLSARASPDRLQTVVVDFHTRSLLRFRNLPHVQTYIGRSADFQDAFSSLLRSLQERSKAAERLFQADPDSFDRDRWLESLPFHLVVIDDYEKLAAQYEGDRRILADCLAYGAGLGAAFLVAGNASELPRDYDDPFLQKMRKQGCGVLLNGVMEIEQFTGAKIPADQRPLSMPSGRGYLVQRGRAQLFQTAAYWEEGEPPEDGLRRRLDAIYAQVRTPDGFRLKK